MMYEPFEERLRLALEKAISDRPRPRISGRTVLSLSVAATLALGVVAAMVAGAFAHGAGPEGSPAATRSASPAGPGDLERSFDTKQPLFVDVPRATTLTEAEAASPNTVAIPASMPTSVSTSTPEVWFSPNTKELGLRYGDQVVILESAWADGQDPATEYAAEAKEWGGEAGQLGGKPAWIAPASQSSYPDINMVHVSVGRIDVTVYSKTSLQDAESIAASMGPSNE